MVFRAGLAGSYFALVTLAFAEVFRILANAWGVTGGAAGLLVQLQVDPLNFQFKSRVAFYYIALALVGAVMLRDGRARAAAARRAAWSRCARTRRRRRRSASIRCA